MLHGTNTRLTRTLAASLLGALLVGLAHADWPQWGGANQDFICNSKGLADKWPEGGPKTLWSRELGEGYSAITHADGKLFTMYRKGDDEFVVALDPSNGQTVWEYSYTSPPSKDHIMQFTAGPRSTPLFDQGRLYVAGCSGVMHCLDARSGSMLWKHDLWKDFNGSFLNHGYSSSPMSYGDTVIMLVGGKDGAIVSFAKADGQVRWKMQTFTNSYSTPRLIKVDGEDQLACFMANEIIGIDPKTGELKWSFAHGNQWGQNICMPTLTDDNVLFFSSVDAGTKALKLKKNGDKTDLEELWSTRKIQLYHVNSIRLGDYVYGSTGAPTGSGPSFFAAVNVKDGKVPWRERGFAKATTLYADGKFIILDEEGKLGLATATPEKLTVLCEAKILDNPAWTVPTLVDKTLYVRDLKKIMALDLGAGN